MMNKKTLGDFYELTAAQISSYHENGFVKLKGVLSSEEISYYGDAISKQVAELSKDKLALDVRDTYGKAFLQLMNLWTINDVVKEFIFKERIGKIAADLMQVDGVRMYHDQALFKEAGGGITPWHADQHYWPLSSSNTITAWIPLQATPLEMGPLEFSAKSQALVEGRELSIGDQSEKVIGEKVRLNDFEHVIEAFDLGEVSFHSGWVFHRAGANTTSETRKVMTIIYMDKDMKLKAPKNSEQENDWKTWCPGAIVGEVINTPLNPILYEKSGV